MFVWFVRALSNVLQALLAHVGGELPINPFDLGEKARRADERLTQHLSCDRLFHQPRPKCISPRLAKDVLRSGPELRWLVCLDVFLDLIPERARTDQLGGERLGR